MRRLKLSSKVVRSARGKSPGNETEERICDGEKFKLQVFGLRPANLHLYIVTERLLFFKQGDGQSLLHRMIKLNASCYEFALAITAFFHH